FILLFEFRKGLRYFVERSDTVQREPNDTRLFSKSLENRLTDPPHRIRDELKTTRFVKALCCLDQAEVTLVDQVTQGEPLVLILLGNRNHEAKVRLRQFFKGDLIPFLNPLSQFHLFIRSKQIHLADLLEVLVQRLAFAVGYLFADL